MRQGALWAVVLSLAAWGAVRLGLWRHEVDVEARIDRYGGLIHKYACRQSLPTELVRAVIRCESRGDEHAASSAGAVGLMQITPITLKEVLRQGQGRVSTGDLEDPEYNILIGTRYLRQMLDRFGQNALLAVAAYNMGPTRLADLQSAHPELSDQQLLDQYAPAETVAYCRNVLGWQARYRGP